MNKRQNKTSLEPSSLSRRLLLKGAALGGSSLLFGKALASQGSTTTAENLTQATYTLSHFMGNIRLVLSLRNSVIFILWC